MSLGRVNLKKSAKKRKETLMAYAVVGIAVFVFLIILINALISRFG